MTIPNHSDAPFPNNWRLRLFSASRSPCPPAALHVERGILFGPACQRSSAAVPAMQE